MSIQDRLKRRSDLISENILEITDVVEDMSKEVSKSLLKGKKILFCGNGGSAAESQHMAAEYCATLDHNKPRDGMPAIALTTDTSFLTAWTNDFGYKEVFKRQLETLGNSGDIVFCYSTSGNSENVCLAAEKANELKIKVLGFTGNSGKTKLGNFCDLIFEAPSVSTPIIQEFHTIVGHEICLRVEKLLSDGK
tara:strand:+ start:11465 stop:12043 length:579 start_codon:yes stop_codon:yes gene_type:complete